MSESAKEADSDLRGRASSDLLAEDLFVFLKFLRVDFGAGG